MPDIVELVLRMTNRTDPQLAPNNRSGGMAMNGGEQILSPLTQRWRFRAEFPILNKSDARTIRAAKSRLKGRFNLLRLRVCDQYRITRSDIGAVDGDVPHSDGAFFSDDSDYALSQPKSPIMVDAAANSTELVIRAADMQGAMSIGVFFSIGDFWMYQIDNWELDGTNYVLQISPPLREAVTTADEVDFDAKCVWQLESDSEGQLDLAVGKFGTVVLNLVEPVDR